MSDIDLATAELWFNIFNVLLVTGAIVIAVGTFGSIKMAAVKERFADQRIAENETETARAKEAAALANAKAAQAQLQLEKFRAPRTISAEQAERIAQKISTWAGMKVSFSVSPESETIALMKRLRGVVTTAGWMPSANQMSDLSIEGAGVYSVEGVEVLVHSSVARGTTIAKAAQVLASVLAEVGIEAIAATSDTLRTTDTINIAVGTKPK